MVLNRQVVAMLLFSWFTLSAFIDFVVIPKAFKLTHEAGSLGIFVFNAVNKIELVSAIAITFLTFRSHLPWKTMFRVMSIFLLLLASFYNLFLTPEITHLSEMMATPAIQAKELGLNLLELQEKHNFYHQLYVSLDSLKLLILLIASVLISINVKSKEGSR